MSTMPLPSPINVLEKQGIVTILGSNLQQNQIQPTLRRTISADMSSRTFLSQNGMSPMRRISSSEELATPSIEVDDQEELKQNMPTHDDVWRSIQSQKEKGSVWSSLLSEKKDNNIGTNDQTPAYVHPLLKKSASNLSQKSLEICTESLGSETGCEGFSSCPASETDNKENEKEEKIEQKIECSEDFNVAKYNYDPSKKLRSQKKSFPPPLPSLHMQSQRKNGRLVLEAVSVPQQNYFQVDRQEGRLLLTLVDNDPQVPNSPKILEAKVEDFQVVFDDLFPEFEVHAVDEKAIGSEYEEEEDEMAIMIEKNSSSFPTSGTINIPMMKSFLGLGKSNSLWSNKVNKVVEFMEAEKVVGITTFPQSLPPPGNMASFNVYEYFWRRNNKPSIAGIIDSSVLTQQCNWNHLEGYSNDKVVLAKTSSHQQEVVIMRGNKGDYFVPLVGQENGRSLLVWQPHCIATS